MPAYTIEQIREVARSKDNRLKNKTQYPDSWIDDKIEQAFETAESSRQVFHAEDTVDLTQFIEDGTEEFTLDMDDEVHFYFDIGVTHYPEISVEVKNDNGVLVKLDIDALSKITDERSITFRYFYFPKIASSEVFMGSEVYHFFRHCLYVQLYGALRDLEKEQYHQVQVDKFITTGTFSMPNNFLENVEMKGSFDLPTITSWQ